MICKGSDEKLFQVQLAIVLDSCELVGLTVDYTEVQVLASF